jgi:hypothetical protein
MKTGDKDSCDAIVYDNEIGVSEGEDPATFIQIGSIVIHKANQK